MVSRLNLLALVAASMICGGECFSLGSLGASLPRARSSLTSSCSPISSSGILAAQMSSVMERRESSLIQESRGCPSRRPNGYWKVWENVEAEILSLADKLDLNGNMPTEAQLRKNSLSSLCDAIHEIGGFALVAYRLGLKTSKPKGFWQDFDNVVTELQGWMEGIEGRKANTLPTQAELRKAGRTDLISAMQLHGGMTIFADHLKLAMSVAGGTKGRQTEYSVRTQLEDHVKDFVSEHGIEGVMPSTQLLKSWGRLDLMRGIERHGGLEHMSRKCGLEIRRADAELVEVAKELYIIAKDSGNADGMPSLKELEKSGRLDLVKIIERKGGLHRTACMIGMRSSDAIPAPAARRSVAASVAASAAPRQRSRAVAPAGQGSARLAEATAAAARTASANRRSASDAVKSYSAKSADSIVAATTMAAKASCEAASNKARMAAMREALKRKLSERSGDAAGSSPAVWNAMF